MARDESFRNTAGTGLAPWQRELAIRLLRSHLAADVHVVELATHCGLSRSHFARAFKTDTGLPPHRWLMRHRIERAQELLERTDDCIAQIALTCGFSDQSHFTRVFHAIAGISPAAWRRRRKAGIFWGGVEI